jgi:cysteine synthase A
MNVYEDNSYSIGKTPLVRLNRIAKESKAVIYAKIEGRNPAYSVKCRIGAAMVWDAEQKGLLKKGMEIVEPTSGNTGIALAFVAAARGYRLTLTMPESMSIERRKILKLFGASLVLTDASLGMKGAISKAEQIVATDPERYYMPQQFTNPANPAIHEQTTGPEIWNDLDGKVDAIVAGVGTGGTITGITRYLKKTMKKEILAVAVEPASSPVILQTIRGEPLTPGSHKIQGLGAGFVPSILDLSLIDRVIPVTNEDSIDMARRLASVEGILSGISCGAAVMAALKLGMEKEMEGKNIVVILPDAGERYLSTPLFDGLFSNLDHATASDSIL